MAQRDDPGLGDLIAQIVDDAVNTREFERLNRSISRTIDEVFDELNIDTGGSTRRSYGAGDWAVGGRSSEGKYSYDNPAGKWARGRNSTGSSGTRDPRGITRSYGENIPKAKVKEPELYAKNPPGQIAGFLQMVFGGIFTAIFGYAEFATLAGTLILGGEMAGGIFGVVAMLPFLIGSIVLLRRGVGTNQRIKRFQAYVRALAGKTYISISELAAAVGKSEEFVRTDLRTMMEKNFFPHGHLDAKGTTLMLDDETWQQYRDAEEAYKQRTREEKKAKTEERIFPTIQADSPELEAAIREGEHYIAQIREANEAIPGEEISRKLDRLEELMRKIFLVLQQKPDQLPKLRKFMNYYMPTTDKLVQTYRELDAQPVEGENISRAKAEIEQTIDTINDAYEKLLDSFYMEAAMDVRSDITVLQNLMAQEGLTSQPFEKREGNAQAVQAQAGQAARQK